MKTNTTVNYNVQVSPLATTAKAITLSISQAMNGNTVQNLLVNELQALNTLANKARNAKKEGDDFKAFQLNGAIKTLKKKIKESLKKVNSDLLKSQINAYTFSGIREYIQLNVFTLFSFGYLKLDKTTTEDGKIEYTIKVFSRRPTMKEIGEMLPDFSTKLFDGLVNTLCGDLAIWDISQRGYKLDKEEYKNLLKLTLKLEGVATPSIKGLKQSINNIMDCLYKGVKPFTTKATLIKIKEIFIKGERVHTFNKKSVIELLPQILSDFCNSRKDEYAFNLTKAQMKAGGYEGKIVTVVTDSL